MLNILLTRMIVERRTNSNSVPNFDADIEFQDLVHEEGKFSVLYCDVKEENLSKIRLNTPKCDLYIFTPIKASNIQRVLKLSNLLLWHHKKGYNRAQNNILITRAVRHRVKLSVAFCACVCVCVCSDCPRDKV